jgi:HSP20 family protein
VKVRDPTAWMWGEALELIERAERMQRQFFRLGARPHAGPVWEPPIDLFETARQFVLVVALPGVDPDRLVIVLDGATLVVRGQRDLPQFDQSTRLHRLELPYGRFERRIDLPTAALALGPRTLDQGCLVVFLDKPGGCS